MNNTLLNDKLTVRIEGAITAGHIDRMLSQFQNLFKERSDFRSLIVDITGINEIDSLGINLLVGLYRECEGRNFKFQITGASKPVLRLFELYKLTGYFGIVQSS